jgi:hypothetical protein
VLFAIERISVMTDDGVHAVSPGTRLKIVRKTDEGFLVTDGKREFPALAHQVTNEIHTAAGAHQAEQADRAAGAVVRQAQDQAQMQLQQVQQQQAAQAQQDALKDKQLRDLDARYSALNTEEATLTAKIQEARDDVNRSYTATHIYGRVSTRTIDPNLRVQWQTRLAAVKEEKRKVELELNRMRFPTGVGR